MAISDPFIGRLEAVGLGIEATAGTGVAAQTWLEWDSQDVMNTVDTSELEAANGTVTEVSDSQVSAKYSGGSIGGAVDATSIGFLMTGYYGSATTGTAVSGVYPHTFKMNQSSKPSPALTILRENPLAPRKHAYGTFDSFELESETGNFVMVSCAVKARVGEATTNTVAIAPGTKFIGKHVTVKLASNLAGLDAASALNSRKVSLQDARPSEMWLPHGTDTDVEFDRGEKNATGEIILRYTDDQYETIFLAGTARALEITIANGDDSLVFTMPKCKFRELERSTDKNGVVTQTLAYKAELDYTEGYDVQGVLNNTRATYEAA